MEIDFRGTPVSKLEFLVPSPSPSRTGAVVSSSCPSVTVGITSSFSGVDGCSVLGRMKLGVIPSVKFCTISSRIFASNASLSMSGVRSS